MRYLAFIYKTLCHVLGKTVSRLKRKKEEGRRKKEEKFSYLGEKEEKFSYLGEKEEERRKKDLVI
ncbi:hypothetical protein [Phormidium nigroviride]